MRGKLFLTLEEVKVQGKGLRLAMVYVFLYETGIVPFNMSIDQFNEICSKTIITQSEKLHYFYQDKKIRVMLKRPANDTENSSLKIDGDPCLLIHDFVLLLSKVGLEILKMTTDGKLDTCVMLEKFFREFLLFRTNEEVLMNIFPGESKTKFHSYLQKLSGQLFGAQNENYGSNSIINDKKIIALKNISRIQEEYFGLDTITQSFKSYFSFQKLNEFSMYKTFKNQESNLKARIGDDDKTNEFKVFVIGVDVPVPKQRNEARKVTIKTKPEKSIQYEKLPDPTPTPNTIHALNFYRVLIKDTAYQDFRYQAIESKILDLELMYMNIETPDFEKNYDCFEYFNCFIASFKVRNFEIAESALEVLSKCIEEEFKGRQELVILAQFLQGMLFEHTEEYELAANCFYRCLRLCDK